MDSSISSTYVLEMDGFSLCLRVSVTISLTYCPTSQESCTHTPFLVLLSTTISDIKLVECSRVLLGRIILSYLLLLVKNYNLGEKQGKFSI